MKALVYMDGKQTRLMKKLVGNLSCYNNFRYYSENTSVIRSFGKPFERVLVKACK